MKYTVVWKPEAERRLAELWMEADDPEQLSDAANLIERELRVNPGAVGEQRIGSIRVVFVAPLGVFFRVSSEDRQVLVLSVWSSEWTLANQPNASRSSFKLRGMAVRVSSLLVSGSGEGPAGSRNFCTNSQYCPTQSRATACRRECLDFLGKCLSLL